MTQPRHHSARMLLEHYPPRIQLAISSVALALILTACASVKGAPDAPRATSVAQKDGSYLVDSQTLAAYKNENDPQRKRTLRNEIIDERTLEIDRQFNTYELELWRQGIGLGIGTDWVQLALAAATATVGGESAKAALGAASTGVVGAKASFDKHAFLDKTLPAVLAQMSAEREVVRARIERSKLLPVADYTLYAALSDLQKMITVGTMPGAIQVIAQDAGDKSKTAEDEIKSVRTGRYSKDDASVRLKAFWRPDGKTVDQKNLSRLKKWMTDHSLSTGAGDVAFFLVDESMADLRLQAARELLD